MEGVTIRRDVEASGQAEGRIMLKSTTETDRIKLDIGKELEPVVSAIMSLSPDSQALVTSLVSQLATREGIDMHIARTRRIALPSEGIPLWVSKLRQESYSPGTIRVYTATLTLFFRVYKTPSRLDIQEWLAKRMETCSPSRVATDRKALRSLFSFLREEGLWHVDPTERIKSIKVPRRSEEPPSPEDVEKLLEYKCHGFVTAQKYRVMTMLLATSGLRLSEACGLLKSGVMFSRHEMRVIGKGNKEGIVPMTEAAEVLLKAWLTDHPAKDSPYVFPGDGKCGYWSISSYEKTLKRACKQFGLRNFHPHTLRHFFATYALSHGAKLEVISKILRHASVGTTADIYRFVLTGEMHDASKSFAPRLSMPGQLAIASPAIDAEFKEITDGKGP
jgi:site-specific recombinase XerD